MDHFKDCMKPINMVDFATRVCMRPGSVTEAEHRALRSIEPTPYKSLAWTTEVGMVRERVEAAELNVEATAFQKEYFTGRYEAFRDLLQEMMERGKP